MAASPLGTPGQPLAVVAWVASLALLAKEAHQSAALGQISLLGLGQMAKRVLKYRLLYVQPLASQSVQEQGQTMP